MEKGLTLRKKGNRRPQQSSAPKEISGPVHLSKDTTKPGSSGSNTLAVPREKNKGGDDTSDFVKRRYSTRFNALPDFSSGAPPVPGIPSIPARYADQVPRPGSRDRPSTGGSQPIRVDLHALRDPALQADKCKDCILTSLQIFPNNSRRRRSPVQCLRAGNTRLSGQPTKDQEQNLHRLATE